ncbi:ABC transporter permease [Solitalea sp. MAHUQ-68]|uniref:ABC transporter permease n=1 Tax=Solitalea agri TaxID=2953739 RepID=A0A9X2F5G0_9SPHI|nr:ABC transporter permease [Solitalea agri]MCO4294666.1 ABC transporter permease [Solitalea agri]
MSQPSTNKITAAEIIAEYLPTSFQNFLIELGSMLQFFIDFFKNLFKRGFEWNAFIRQCFEVGYRSIGLVSLTAFIMGLVMTLQSQPTLANFGAESWLPGMVSISIVREIGPVITSLLCAGKIASSIGAELGSMKVTEQIDAMEVSGSNPMKYLVVTRILATTLTIPLLVILSDAVSFCGSWVAVNINSTMSAMLFFNKIFATIEYEDLIPSFIKSILFGFAVGFIGCYKGYNSNKGTESVGVAANSAVVTSSISIFLIDMLVVQITNLLY